MQGPDDDEFACLSAAARAKHSPGIQRMEHGSPEHRLFEQLAAKGWFDVSVNEWGGDHYTISERGLMALRIEEAIRAGKGQGK